MWTIVESSADKTAHLPEFDDPLILGEEPRTPARWRAMMGYLAGCVILSICLLVQVFYHYQDYFLRHSLWRPLLASACEQLACELPVVKNSSALRSVYLSVDPHPDYQDMLLVRFRVHNTAMYPQAFPAVQLSFSNTEQEIVAARRFYPGHYLPLELLPAGAIAQGAQLDGALAVRDPGPNAVNYTLEFVYEND
ncbi:MAG: DUF3426 domain-containing protein [Pseudohongiella sp.]|nr:DUF3426 domain-containing protein [Pseudohongiella sp.]